jgi:hypothetical protein
MAAIEQWRADRGIGMRLFRPGRNEPRERDFIRATNYTDLLEDRGVAMPLPASVMSGSIYCYCSSPYAYH